MSFKEFIKQNRTIRKIGKSINIYRAFYRDAKSFSRFYMEKAEQKGDYRYSILLLAHSLEKGMCMNNLRPFGGKKIIELINMLKVYNGDYSEYEYQIGVSAISSWKKLCEEKGWHNEKGYKEAEEFLISVQDPSLHVGSKEYPLPDFSPADISGYEKVVLSRSSVRDYKPAVLSKEDIQLAINCFSKAPTACNRQMCRIIHVKSESIKKLLSDNIIGISGINTESVSYFIICYDLSAFAYSGERQQGMFNAGLCTMNFVNGLHANGIGTCCLQWSNNHSSDLKIRNSLGLKESERIAVVVAAGYYKESNTIPCSIRRNIDEIYDEV